MSKEANNIKRLSPGQLLFRQGDPGGDLFCIDQGTVEIFAVRDGHEVVYTEMGAGEIIGIMTCLTAEPRMAAARAKTEVVCRLVPHGKIEQALSRMPQWFRVVIKEYTNRLDEMNRRYSEVTTAQKDLLDNQISHRYTARQLAAVLVNLATLQARRKRGPPVIQLEESLELAAAALLQPRSVIDQLFRVLGESGVVRVDNDPESRKPVLRPEQIKKLAYFNDFVGGARLTKNRRLLKLDFRGRETKALLALAKLGANKGDDVTKEQAVSLKEANETLGKRPELSFNEECLEKAAQGGLLQQEGEGANGVLRFVPERLSRLAAIAAAWRRLGVLDRTSGNRLATS